MKLIKGNSPFLEKNQWLKVLFAMSVMTIALYSVAMVFSLLGSKYFILNYQNDQMDRIEAWFRQRNIYAILTFVFMTIESSIVISFTLQKISKWYYCVSYYVINIVLALILKNSFQMAFTFSQIFLSLGFIFLDTAINKDWKKIGWKFLRFAMAMAITLVLQVMIFVIKNGNWSMENHVMNLSATFIYEIEYEIALFVILMTISLFIHREKGDSKLWETAQVLGGFSQTSTTQSRKSLLKKTLTKTQRSKIRWLYAKFYLTQILGFLTLMILPFLLGKVFEFLVMYLSFAVTRYILGFKYSLHYKKEAICISVGVLVFGILSLAVPFFYVVVILAVAIGSGLAVLLHFSYKYQSAWLFAKMAKPDKFALLYVFFDGDLSEHNVKKMCKLKCLTDEQLKIIWDYVQGNKISYLAWKYSYSTRTLIYKLDEAIEKLVE